jgi:hypothetical protein
LIQVLTRAPTEGVPFSVVKKSTFPVVFVTVPAFELFGGDRILPGYEQTEDGRLLAEDIAGKLLLSP